MMRAQVQRTKKARAEKSIENCEVEIRFCRANRINTDLRFIFEYIGRLFDASIMFLHSSRYKDPQYENHFCFVAIVPGNVVKKFVKECRRVMPEEYEISFDGSHFKKYHKSSKRKEVSV